MYFSAIATLLVGAVMSQSADPTRIYFNCNSTTASGFSPKCCTDVNGQVGVNCIGAHQMGATDPIFECNLYVYNITGCCQSTGFKNPATNYTLDLCATSIDPI
ncbi:hypothetical protein F5Y19DRAFT_176485 [Xylariaceae sp. FL1651]|nr:hypothetical protein F5Y19DRAFT_176485 [Xylariaceae sp. FL1651]